jgi:hypothetical protein
MSAKNPRLPRHAPADDVEAPLDEEVRRGSGAEVWVEIESPGPPVCGVVHHLLGRDVPFEGWLELVSALEASPAAGPPTAAGGSRERHPLETSRRTPQGADDEESEAERCP